MQHENGAASNRSARLSRSMRTGAAMSGIHHNAIIEELKVCTLFDGCWTVCSDVLRGRAMVGARHEICSRLTVYSTVEEPSNTK